jgi:hypothetical protein
MMSEPELDELTKDLKDKGGLIHQVVFYGDELLDGRNRIEAIERSGLLDVEVLKDKDCRLRTQLADGIDPYEYVLSANLHRRNLTEEQRRALIAEIIKAKPEASDRAIAKKVKRDHKTVAKVRKKLQSTGEVSPVVGADGKKRVKPKRKVGLAPPRHPHPEPERVEQRATGSAEISIDQRRAENARLDESRDDDIVDRALALVAAMDDEQRRQFHDQYIFARLR